MLFGVALGWGLNWPAMKLILGEVPPWQFRALTGIAGGIVLFALAVSLRERTRQVIDRESGNVFRCAPERLTAIWLPSSDQKMNGSRKTCQSGQDSLRPRGRKLERVAGIEPARSAWEADRLPLHHTRLTDAG